VLAVRATALAARTVLAGQAAASRGTIDVIEGHTRRDMPTDTRDYVFVVGITNPPTSERRFREPTLRVTYRTRANFLGAVDLTASEPVAVTGGERAKVTLRFSTSNVIPRHCRIDAYTLVFAEEGGVRTTVDASLPEVLQSDTDGAGPATWGWD
jgi:hypothetical protein